MKFGLLKISIFILFAIALEPAVADNTSMNDDKKFERFKTKGDRRFEEFSMDEAIENYKKAIDIKPSHEVNVQLANCYRLLNNPEESAKWYERAMDSGKLSSKDMLNYGQTLSALGRYDESADILEEYQHVESWVDDKVEGLNDLGQFYRNKEAFSISESIFNTDHKDFSPTYREDDIVFVSSRRSAGLFKPEYNWDESNFLDLFLAEEGKPIEKIHRGINTRYHEGPAVFFGNDQKMLFTRNNYTRKKAKKSDDGVNMLKLYYSTRKNEKRWNKPVEVPFNSDDYSTGHPAITSDGQTVYFASDMPGGLGGVDLYKVSFNNGVWGTPENLGARFNTEEDEMFPFLHNDSTLYFASNGHEGLGSLDLFRAFIYEEQEPRNMGFPLNTNADDFGITLKDGVNKGYFSSNREGGTGDDDIYEVILFDYIIDVLLIDAETGDRLTGDMDADELINDEKVALDSVRESSKITFRALRGTKFVVGGIAPDYLPDTLNIETAEASREITRLTYELPLSRALQGEATIILVRNNHHYTQHLWMKDTAAVINSFEGSEEEMIAYLEEEKLEVVNRIVLKNIFYDFDKSNIREDAQVEMDSLASFMKNHPDLKVELSAHTDFRADHTYNRALAKRRAGSAKNYLLEKGIDEERILTSSFGEEDPHVDCEECNEEQHQTNRRTEIRLILPDEDEK